VRDLAFDRASAPSLYGHTGATLEIYQPRLGEWSPGDLTGPLLDINLRPPERPPVREPSLAPGTRRIALAPGERRTVRYRLDPGTRPTPLDVSFLIDTTDSMGPFLAALVDGIAGIINELHGRGVDVRFGVGEYRSYPHSPQQNDPERNFVYRRVRDIEPYGPSLTAALEGLRADAGGPYTAELAGLYQTATGEGQDVYPPGPLGANIPRGQQANFRAGAERIVIHAADGAFSHADPSDPNPRAQDIPDEADVIDALNARSILQIGLAIGRGRGGESVV
jgi:hypothetical protein